MAFLKEVREAWLLDNYIFSAVFFGLAFVQWAYGNSHSHKITIFAFGLIHWPFFVWKLIEESKGRKKNADR